MIKAIEILERALSNRLTEIWEQYGIHDPNDDPTGLCVDLQHLISILKGE